MGVPTLSSKPVVTLWMETIVRLAPWVLRLAVLLRFLHNLLPASPAACSDLTISAQVALPLAKWERIRELVASGRFTDSRRLSIPLYRYPATLGQILTGWCALSRLSRRTTCILARGTTGDTDAFEVTFDLFSSPADRSPQGLAS